MDLLLSEDAWVVPSCNGNPHCFDMRSVYRAEARLVELSGITKARAGELLHCVIEACDVAKRYLATLKAEFGRSKQRLRRVRGVIVLDRAPEKLKALGLVRTGSPAGSEDLRDAVVNTDPEYETATEHLLQIEAAVDVMDSKVEKLKMAYYSINDLIKGTDIGRSNISGGVGDDEPGALTREEKAQEFAAAQGSVKAADYSSGFGAPRF